MCVHIKERENKNNAMGQKVNNWCIWVEDITGGLCTVIATFIYV